MLKLLTGHTSQDTAYLVTDYPYGFTLRCKIRYWLEFHPHHGTRFMSQTSNPKRGHAWNKPKASTYAKFGGAMYLNDNDHVTWSGLTEYTDAAEAIAWRDTYGAGVPADGVALLNKWVAAKVVYDARKGML